jgi:hypothetical protein
MNAKQRKTAEKMRQRASLDADSKVRELEEARRLFAAEREIEKIRVEERMAELKTLEAHYQGLEVQFSKREEAHRVNLANDRSIQLTKLDLLKEANIVRETLLLLELDEDPATIALRIREKFGLLIPEW